VAQKKTVQAKVRGGSPEGRSVHHSIWSIPADHKQARGKLNRSWAAANTRSSCVKGGIR